MFLFLKLMYRFNVDLVNNQLLIKEITDEHVVFCLLTIVSKLFAQKTTFSMMLQNAGGKKPAPVLSALNNLSSTTE